MPAAATRKMLSSRLNSTSTAAPPNPTRDFQSAACLPSAFVRISYRTRKEMNKIVANALMPASMPLWEITGCTRGEITQKKLSKAAGATASTLRKVVNRSTPLAALRIPAMITRMRRGSSKLKRARAKTGMQMNIQSGWKPLAELIPSKVKPRPSLTCWASLK